MNVTISVFEFDQTEINEKIIELPIDMIDVNHLVFLPRIASHYLMDLHMACLFSIENQSNLHVILLPSIKISTKY